MQIIFDIFNTIFFGPIVNLLVVILHSLEALHIPGALGWSIVLMTILIRILIWPFISTQLKSSKKMMELKPALDVLKQKHSKDKQALSQAQLALYKENGVNPASGCLPALIQIPIVIALYQSILALFDNVHGLEKINNLLYNDAWKITTPPDSNFFGLNLAAKPSEFSTIGFLVLLIPVITALLQFIQTKMMMPAPLKEYKNDTPKEKKEKEDVEDAMSAVQGQMMYLMPIMIGYFAFSFPIGLAIYWNTFTIVGIWHQYTISGWGSAKALMQLLPLKKA